MHLFNSRLINKESNRHHALSASLNILQYQTAESRSMVGWLTEFLLRNTPTIVCFLCVKIRKALGFHSLTTCILSTWAQSQREHMQVITLDCCVVSIVFKLLTCLLEGKHQILRFFSARQPARDPLRFCSNSKTNHQRTLLSQSRHHTPPHSPCCGRPHTRHHTLAVVCLFRPITPIICQRYTSSHSSMYMIPCNPTAWSSWMWEQRCKEMVVISAGVGSRINTWVL
jgi:hypothetical protein